MRARTGSGDPTPFPRWLETLWPLLRRARTNTLYQFLYQRRLRRGHTPWRMAGQTALLACSAGLALAYFFATIPHRFPTPPPALVFLIGLILVAFARLLVGAVRERYLGPNRVPLYLRVIVLGLDRYLPVVDDLHMAGVRARDLLEVIALETAEGALFRATVLWLILATVLYGVVSALPPAASPGLVACCGLVLLIASAPGMLYGVVQGSTCDLFRMRMLRWQSTLRPGAEHLEEPALEIVIGSVGLVVGLPLLAFCAVGMGLSLFQPDTSASLSDVELASILSYLASGGMLLVAGYLVMTHGARVRLAIRRQRRDAAALDEALEHYLRVKLREDVSDGETEPPVGGRHLLRLVTARADWLQASRRGHDAE